MSLSLDQILKITVDDYRKLKANAQKAFDQLDEADFHFKLDGDQNSICVIVKHMAGNMLSRWTDFLTSDGEKPSRSRDHEFTEETLTRQQILDLWERGWACTFDAVEKLRGEDLGRTILIRGEPMSVFAAINRQTAHYAYHVGQIILLAKHIRGRDWKYITIPRGQSQQFNQQMLSKQK